MTADRFDELLVDLLRLRDRARVPQVAESRDEQLAVCRDRGVEDFVARGAGTRSASRTVMRETPNCSASSRSDCSRSPGESSAAKIARSIWETISPEARAWWMGVNTLTEWYDH